MTIPTKKLTLEQYIAEFTVTITAKIDSKIIDVFYIRQSPVDFYIYSTDNDINSKSEINRYKTLEDAVFFIKTYVKKNKRKGFYANARILNSY